MIFLVGEVGCFRRKTGCCVGAWARLFSDRRLIRAPHERACGVAWAAARAFWFSPLRRWGWLGTQCPQVYNYVWEGKEDNLTGSLDRGGLGVGVACGHGCHRVLLRTQVFSSQAPPPGSTPIHIPLCQMFRACDSANGLLTSCCELGPTAGTSAMIISFRALRSRSRGRYSCPAIGSSLRTSPGKERAHRRRGRPGAAARSLQSSVSSPQLALPTCPINRQPLNTHGHSRGQHALGLSRISLDQLCVGPVPCRGPLTDRATCQRPQKRL